MLAVAVAVVLTGGLHQDGLADTCDGLGARGDRARRLAVMRESTIGTFGALALLVWALLLVTALARVTPAHALRILIAAEAFARLAPLLHALLARPARPGGLGTLLPARRWPALAAGVVALAVGVAVTGPGRAALAFLIAAASAAASAAVARRAIGGSTGDTLGAAAAVSEALVCVALGATWH